MPQPLWPTRACRAKETFAPFGLRPVFTGGKWPCLPCANKLSKIIQRALCLLAAKELASALRGRFHQLWLPPPKTRSEDPHFWRNLLAPKGLVLQASGVRWNQIFRLLNEMLLSAPGDVGEVEGVHLDLISYDPDWELWGMPKLRRVKAIVRGAPSRLFASNEAGMPFSLHQLFSPTFSLPVWSWGILSGDLSFV